MASTLSGTNMPQPATFAPSKDDILGALGFYFGQPVSPEKLKDYNEHHAATYHFPDAYVGSNTKIRDTINNLVEKQPQTWHTTIGLPFRRIEGTVVEWDEIRFDVRLMQRVPYQDSCSDYSDDGDDTVPSVNTTTSSKRHIRVEENIFRNNDSSKFWVGMNVCGEYVWKNGYKSLVDAREAKETMVAEREAARKPRNPSGRSKAVRVKPNIILKNASYFATCSVNGVSRRSVAQPTLEAAENELMKLKELQTEGIEHRYEHVYKKKKEFSIEKKRKRSEDQKRYMESKGKALRKQRTKPKKLKDVESSKKKAREYAKHDKFVAASRCRLYKLVKKKGIKKGGQTVSLIGCNRHDFLVHLTSQLRPGESMDDHTVDHIFPLDSYDLHDPVQLSNAFSYKNTQPLTMRENTSKGARLPTKAMAEKVPVGFWPEGVTMQELKDIYNGWANGLRLHTSDVLLSRRVD